MVLPPRTLYSSHVLMGIPRDVAIKWASFLRRILKTSKIHFGLDTDYSDLGFREFLQSLYMSGQQLKLVRLNKCHLVHRLKCNVSF
jgi:hypothetical protein